MFEDAVSVTDIKAQERALAALCAALDPDAVPLSEADGAWQSFAAIERLAAGAKSRLARRVEQAQSWRREGD
ncbi:MAG: hypothetical protein ACRD0U_03945, partial [Acidimicrobiales bacterium]